MNRDQAKGAVRKAKGQAKESVGKSVGNERMQTEGTAEKVAGKAQQGYGDVKRATK